MVVVVVDGDDDDYFRCLTCSRERVAKTCKVRARRHETSRRVADVLAAAAAAATAVAFAKHAAPTPTPTHTVTAVAATATKCAARLNWQQQHHPRCNLQSTHVCLLFQVAMSVVLRHKCIQRHRLVHR